MNETKQVGIIFNHVYYNELEYNWTGTGTQLMYVIVKERFVCVYKLGDHIQGLTLTLA